MLTPKLGVVVELEVDNIVLVSQLAHSLLSDRVDVQIFKSDVPLVDPWLTPRLHRRFFADGLGKAFRFLRPRSLSRTRVLGLGLVVNGSSEVVSFLSF